MSDGSLKSSNIMANLTIPFPEGTRTVVLRGKHITIGRLPENVIQVRDRTISAHHAELFWEEGHYRIHDVDSTNGILVNGQQVVDYHLLEPCTVRLGNMDCEFKLEDPTPAEKDDVDPLPSRGEMLTLQQDNKQLKANVSALREQLETMNAAQEGQAAGGEDGTLTQLAKLSAELAALKQENVRRQEEFDRLKDSLSVMRRDRENLQRAYDTLNASTPKPVAKPVAAPAAKLVASHSAPPAPPAAPGLAMPNKLPKPPVSLGAASGTPSTPSPSTPTRRPASGITPGPRPVVATPIPAAPEPALAGSGPKGTEKLTE